MARVRLQQIPLPPATPCPNPGSATGDQRRFSQQDIARLIADDNAVWREFVHAFGPCVNAVIRKTLALSAAGLPAEEVDDILQEVCLRLFQDDHRRLRQYDPAKGSFPAWLTLVAHSVAVDCLRRSQPPTASIEELGDILESLRLPESPGFQIPDGVLSERETLLIQSHYVEGLTVPETAERMNLSPKTVQNCKSSAINKLREHFRHK